MSSSTASHGHSASSVPPKPPRQSLSRSPSDPVNVSHRQGAESSTSSPSPPAPQQIYVLSADGSNLFLLDPSKPANEEPPPYAPFQPSPTGGHTTSRSLSSTNIRADAGSSSPRRLLSPQRLGHANYLSLDVDDAHTRHRASTLSALGPPQARPRFHSSASRPQIRSAVSSPGVPHRIRLPDETTPLLAAERDDPPLDDPIPQRGLWRSIFCGDVDHDEPVGGWGRGWKRFWRPWSRSLYWRAAFHLVVLNFPFALLIWPWLVVGTLVGTALLITLPLGAAVWWITLFLSRSAARLETIMQLRYHSPLHPSVPTPTYHPIFYRIKERSAPTSPISPIDEFPPEIQWEKRFVKCSYAMFADHYSYSALSYFLLIKPLITLFSTIAIVALFPVCLVLVFPFPIYLRAIRRWGKWQAGIAIGNL